MARSSVRIGSILGIPIYLHYSFLLILPFLAWAFGNNIKALAAHADVPAGLLGLSPYVWGLLIALGLFGSVLLHELGHSVVAMRKHVSIRGITLMIMGGVAHLEEMPEKPGDEAQIAIAGPVTSFLVAAACYVALPFTEVLDHPNLAFALAYVGYMNLFLGGFNLLPAFPMDGGRILRSVLAKWKPFVSATKIAVDVGKAFAFLFGIYGLLSGNFILVLIAFFVYMGASQELHYTVMRTTLDGFRVSDLMSTQVATVSPDTSIRDLIDRMLRERHMGYPVTDGDRLVGCVTLEDIEEAKLNKPDARQVSEIMTTGVVTVQPRDDIYMALKRMNEREIGRLPVVEAGQLVGILSRSDVMRGFQLRQLQAR
jgi:Zn-dependent protease/CBS domain-containing protein